MGGISADTLEQSTSYLLITATIFFCAYVNQENNVPIPWRFAACPTLFTGIGLK
jgi:hypothetical protein